MALFLWIAPGNLPLDVIGAGAAQVPEKLGHVTYYDHFLSVIPNNIMKPYLEGNVLSVMFISASVGLAFAFMHRTEGRETVLKVLFGLQELLFTLIKVLLYVLPIGILAFAGQLSAQIEAGVIVGALGKYTAVVIGGNLIQFFIVIPLSLMSSIGAPIGLLGIILPIYTIIDMIETAENVWSEASVCAMVDHDLQGKLDDSSGDDMPQFQGA